MNERTKTAAWAHSVEMSIGRGENKMRGGRRRSALPPQGSNINFYLLVIAVWERQDGANTALKTHTAVRSQHSALVHLLFTFGLMLSLYMFIFKAGFRELTWHLSMSSWAPFPGSVCTATAPQTDSVLPCRCSPLSAAPRQTATARQTEGLQRRGKKINIKYALINICIWVRWIYVMWNEALIAMNLQRITSQH